MTEPRVYSHHARQAGAGRRVTCANGIHAWCDRHGIDMKAFLRDGIEGERLLAIGDYYSLAALALARKEAGHG